MIFKTLLAPALAVAASLLMTGAAAAQTKAAKPGAPPDFKLVVEPRALALLKASGETLAAAKAMSFTATVSYEYPSRLGPPILYTVRYDVTMQRPDKLKVITPGDGPPSEFYYDGRTVMAYAPDKDLVAIADAPPTIDDALRAMFEDTATYYPFSDLVVADPYRALTNGTILAFTIGTSEEFGGTRTDMVAWANDGVFLQIWIGADDKLPRRIRAVYKNDALQLRHQMDLTNWRIDPVLSPDAFTSAKAQAAKRMAFASPEAALRPEGTPLFLQGLPDAGPAAKPKP